jgi:hypothetical protein
MRSSLGNCGQELVFCLSSLSDLIKSAWHCNAIRISGDGASVRMRAEGARKGRDFSSIFEGSGTAGWIRTNDLLIHNQAL